MTNKPLKINKDCENLYHFFDGEKVFGHNPNMFGDCSDLQGDCTGLWGDCTGLKGDCTDLRGNCSGLEGNLDKITKEQRVANSNIRFYAEEPVMQKNLFRKIFGKRRTPWIIKVQKQKPSPLSLEFFLREQAKLIAECKGDINKLAMKCVLAQSALEFALYRCEVALSHIEALLEDYPSNGSDTFDLALKFLRQQDFKNGEGL